MANALTVSRMVLSAALLLCPACSPAFWTLYLAAGLSDMLDGPVARKTGTASDFGARLDTAADLLFVTVCLAKLLPALTVPLWLWIWTAVIALVKILNLVSSLVLQKKLPAVHTTANRLTGAVLFALPLTLRILPLSVSALPVCVLATFAAVQEGHLIRTQSTDRSLPESR